MTAAPRVPPAPNEGHALWERLTSDDDPTASSDLACAYRDSLAEWLKRCYPRVDPDDCDAAAHNAIITLIKNPTTYKPERQTLDVYLHMSAAGDLKNILRAEKRHRDRRADLEAVEHSSSVGKYLWDEEADPAFVVERNEDEAAAAAAAATLRMAIVQGLSPKETRVLDLMQAGERKTGTYARVLGIEDRPTEEQKREVKRVKDRLKKRIERAGHDHA